MGDDLCKVVVILCSNVSQSIKLGHRAALFVFAMFGIFKED